MGLVSGYRVIAGSIRDLPEPLARAAEERLAPLDRAAIVIGVAVVIYLAARRLGHGRAGPYACVALLIANAAVVAALRVRWFDGLGAFVGCAVYLLRP